VVIFFLIYGVEVFFKVRGGFTVTKVPAIINARRPRDSKNGHEHQETGHLLIVSQTTQSEAKGRKGNVIEHPLPLQAMQPANRESQMVNASQLHQSRLGLLSQALMMIITTGFLFAETLEEFWKTKVNLTSRNTHDIVFRTIEIGVALWFPCVLWNCIRPEQLWCLNPKKFWSDFLLCVTQRTMPLQIYARGLGMIPNPRQHQDHPMMTMPVVPNAGFATIPTAWIAVP